MSADSSAEINSKQRLARHVVVPSEVDAQQEIHRVAREGELALSQGLVEATIGNQTVGVPVVCGRVAGVERERMAEALGGGSEVERVMHRCYRRA